MNDGLFKRYYKKLKDIFKKKKEEGYDFNKSNPLGGNGERVDIQLQNDSSIDFDKLDMYQQNHYRRYEFAKEKVQQGDVCGDFACGTGYGSIMIADKAKLVVGIDLNTSVIDTIKERYCNKTNVTFLNENLLKLLYINFFDTIISFETLEHFAEGDIKILMAIFSKSLKEKGKLIFSTPYMQEKSENAIALGFHLTFYIDEEKLSGWLNEAGLYIELIRYQNYGTHVIENDLEKKDFIICVASKKENA